MAEDQFDGNEFFGGLTRSARHFHTPRLAWDRSGLNLPLIPRFESSVRWAQLADQGLTGRAAWGDARDAFFSAATAFRDTDRQQRYADTFRILGQLMHLVADLAQPAHSRNDSHALGDDFEKYMAAPENRGLIAGYKTFDPAIVQVATGDPVARIPIAHIWDANRYDGSNPPGEAESATFGLSEISSANFFSPGTISPVAFADGTLPLPAVDRLDLASIERYTTGENRSYRGKSGPGLRVQRMVAEGVFYHFLPPFITNFALDDLVFRDYATHLLPRAIGYASGLLDYFFRGRIEIAPPSRFAYGLARYEPGNAGRFTSLRLKVRNATSGEATGTGQLVAVVQYRSSLGDDLLQNPAGDISSEIFLAVSAPIVPATLTDSFQEIAFDFSESPIPANAADVFLTVVYRGPLGLEQDAVVVGGKDLFEPAQIDVANVSDWECVHDMPYQVSDLFTYPPYRVPDRTQRDVNHDGVQDLFGPGIVRGQFLKTFDLAQQAPLPSETFFDLSVGVSAPTQYARLMLLQDRASYGAIILARSIEFVPSGLVQTNTPSAGVLSGIRNDVVAGPGGVLTRRFVLPSQHRGLVYHHAFLLSTPGTFPCFDDTHALSPPLTRIDGVVP